MKKIFSMIICLFSIILLSGCTDTSTMEDINIYTTAYPIEYIVNRLYDSHSTIRSIYPNGVDINEYKLTDVLLNEYSNDADMFIFIGLSDEKNYLKPMLKQNKSLKIIDVTSDISYNKAGIEELWLDPSKLLTIANNIRKGFNEYTEAKYLKNDVDKKYKELKVDLTNLEAKYREAIKYADNKAIIVSDDIFLFLKNYGANVISLDSDNPEYEKNMAMARTLVYSNQVRHIYLKDDENNDIINSLIEGTSVEKVSINTLSTLTDDERNNYDYISLMTDNLEKIKKELYN